MLSADAVVPAEGLQQLLELENDPAFLELVCPTTGVIAWPAIRNDVFRLLLGDRLYDTAPITDLQRQPSLQRVALGALRAAAHNFRHPPEHSDVLILSTGEVTEVTVLSGGEPFASTAAAAVKKWRYRPARFEGKPVATFRIIRIPFKLTA